MEEKWVDITAVLIGAADLGHSLSEGVWCHFAAMTKKKTYVYVSEVQARVFEHHAKDVLYAFHPSFSGRSDLSLLVRQVESDHSGCNVEV